MGKIKTDIKRKLRNRKKLRDLGKNRFRISVYLGIPMLSPDAIIAETLESRSMGRRIFMDAKVFLP